MNNGEKYVQAIDYLRKCTISLENISTQSRDYALNQHPDLIEQQTHELKEAREHLNKIMTDVLTCYQTGSFETLDQIDKEIEQLNSTLESFKKAQLSRIKQNDV